jgi:hypothetical protein
VRDKPRDVFDRDREWDALARFANGRGRGPRFGLVAGRRRQGKTHLLVRLCRELEGLYWCAHQRSSLQLLDSFSDAYAVHATSRPVRFRDWGGAFDAICGLGTPHAPAVVVLDEFSWLVDAAPEVPSVLQTVIDQADRGAVRLIVCGSDTGAMRSLLDGRAPLRGRAQLELIVAPFEYRDAARFWGVNRNPDLAFRLHALVGGTPDYLNQAAGDTPTDGNLDRWVIDRLLDRSSPLLREGRVVLAEDPALGGRSVFAPVLSAVAAGASDRATIAASTGRPSGSIEYPLAVLTEAGWLARCDDPRRERGARWELAEPIVRLHQLVIEPAETLLAAGRAVDVWEQAQPIVASRIYGPHLETLARSWIIRHASADTLGGLVTNVGPTRLPGGRGAQVDLAVVERSSRGKRNLIALGEVKAEAEPVGPAVLERLDDVARQLVAMSESTGPVRRLIVARGGFTGELRRIARRRDDVELVDLVRLYNGT